MSSDEPGQESREGEETLGDLISHLYTRYLVVYDGDEDAASVATAYVVNRILSEREVGSPGDGSA